MSYNKDWVGLLPEMVFFYKNYKGKSAYRKVLNPRVWFGTTIYHPDPQWFLTAYDTEKDDIRDFAIKDIIEFIK